jgi:hypothetical protein
MRFFDWIKSKWNGVDKDPPDACFHLTFLCQDPEHHVCVDKPEPAQENKRKVYPRKRLAKQRTRKRGIERRRVIINCFDQDVENFINEILVFDDVSRIEKPMIYEEYEEWCNKKHILPRPYNGFFSSFNYSCRDKNIYSSKNKENKGIYVGIGLQSCCMRND